MSIWGIRKCLVCDKDFEPQYPAQVACSPECAEKRKRALKKACNFRYRGKIKNMLAECLAGRSAITALEKEVARLQMELDNFKGASEISRQQNDTLLAKIDELEEKNARLAEIIKKKDAEIEKLNGYLKKRISVNAKGSIPASDSEKDSAIQDFKSRNALQTCERLKLSAMKLPCGKKPQCWDNPQCDKCKGMKKPESLYKISSLPEQSLKEVEDEL